jgi:hypothetical protein
LSHYAPDEFRHVHGERLRAVRRGVVNCGFGLIFCGESPFETIALPSRNQRSGDEAARNTVFMTRTPALMCVALSCLKLLLACAHPEPINGSDSGGATNDGLNATGGGDALAMEPDFCAARVVLRDKCQRCHQDPTQNGAPFSLLSYADTQVVDRKGVPRFQKMKAAIETDYMPPTFLELEPAVEPLRESERATLLLWLSSDLPPDNPDCE